MFVCFTCLPQRLFIVHSIKFLFSKDLFSFMISLISVFASISLKWIINEIPFLTFLLRILRSTLTLSVRISLECKEKTPHS